MSCGCALCQPPGPLSTVTTPATNTGRISQRTPEALLAMCEQSMAVLMKARMLALIQAELDQLPRRFSEEDWRETSAYRTLLRLRRAVETMEIPG